MQRRTRGAAFIAAALGLSAWTLPATAHAAAPPASAPLSRVQVQRLAAGATHSVIVVFKDQVSALPATTTSTARRRAAVAVVQSPVVSELRELHAPKMHSFTLLNAVSAEVSSAERARLAADPAVAEVVPDVTTQLNFGSRTPAVTVKAGGKVGTAANPATSMTSGHRVCDEQGPGGVELDPQALQAIRADDNDPKGGPTAASLGITGAGVKTAFIAEGIDVNQPNFQRSNGSNVIVDQADFTGEGNPTNTSGGEASLDASSIAAQGNIEYTATLADGSTCHFVVRGAAPGADVVSLKAFPSDHDATTTSLLEAIDYAVSTDHVNVLSESFGYNPLPDTMTDVIRQADDAAVAAGTVVDVSSGDAGLSSTQGSPSTDPAVISAGASTTYRTYAQEDIEGYSELGAHGWENDNLSGLSSAGETFGMKGPNLLAPGDLNWVTCNPGPNQFGACISGGTSESAPLTTGTAALVIQAYRKTHGGATPTPALVKRIILSTTRDLQLPADQQGSGLLDAYDAVKLAESVGHSAAHSTGQTVSLSTSDITATAAAGSTVVRPVTVKNTGSTSQNVHFEGRALSDPSAVSTQTFTATGSSWTRKFTFTVHRGQSYLNTHVSVGPKQQGGSADVQLIDPSGRFAEAGLTQGTSNTINAGVRLPEAGSWTAYVDYSGGQSSGGVRAQFVATTQVWHRFGTVQPSSVRLAPGQSATVNATLPTPAGGGDQSAAIAVSHASGSLTSIPVALRALVPFRNGVGRFSAALTGGNGRAGAPATAAYFAFDVPAGEPALNVEARYTAGRSNDYSLYLISPSGQALGHASNQLLTAGTVTDPGGFVDLPGASSHVVSPQAGRWIAVVSVANPASSPRAISQLSGTIDFTSAAASASGVPKSASTIVKVGTKNQVTVRITNRSHVPQEYFLDARLAQLTDYSVTALTPSHVTLPLSTSAQIPQWIVPTDTTSVTATASASAPVTFDMSPYLGDFGGELNGDPQVGATPSGDSASATFTDKVVTPGDWNVDPALTGTFRRTGAPDATADLAMTATTREFDPAVHTSYGDLWEGDNSVAPIIAAPGQTVTLHATITPTKAGPVKGTLFVDTAGDISPYGQPIAVGDQVAAVPYRYTAK